MKEPAYKKLLEYHRNGLAEQVHYGLIVYMNKKQVISKIGNDNSYKFYHRSCMKPLQAASLIDLQLDKKYNFTQQELAICCASHTGDIIHQNTVLSVLNKIGFSEADLLCKPQDPLSRTEKVRLIKNNITPRPIHNNCSGKHSAMLAICKEKNFDVRNYKNFDNPLTEFVLNRVCELCEIDIKNAQISKDGCGLPVLATTLEELGRGFLNLFTNPKYEKLTSAFINNPFIIGGEKRLDSDIMSADKNHILAAKVGACGLCVVVDILREECIVVKIADSNMDARALVTIEALKQLNRPEYSNEFFDRLDYIYSKDILSQDGDMLGKAVPCFKLC